MKTSLSKKNIYKFDYSSKFWKKSIQRSKLASSRLNYLRTKFPPAVPLRHTGSKLFCSVAVTNPFLAARFLRLLLSWSIIRFILVTAKLRGLAGQKVPESFANLGLLALKCLNVSCSVQREREKKLYVNVHFNLHFLLFVLLPVSLFLMNTSCSA